MILICALLGLSRNRTLHYVLVSLITIFVILNTLIINYEIS